MIQALIMAPLELALAAVIGYILLLLRHPATGRHRIGAPAPAPGRHEGHIAPADRAAVALRVVPPAPHGRHSGAHPILREAAAA